MTGHTFRIDGNRLRFGGVSFGHGDSDPFLVARNRGWMVVRTPSTSEWQEVGRQMAVPAEWLLWRAEPLDTCPDIFRVAEVVRREKPGRFWRRCRDEMIRDLEDAARRGAVVMSVPMHKEDCAYKIGYRRNVDAPCTCGLDIKVRCPSCGSDPDVDCACNGRNA